MSRPIEQALNNLIPRHPGSIPPELIELASSLLAQSRSKISNLRAEEEIGRTYACANLACERYFPLPSTTFSYSQSLDLRQSSTSPPSSLVHHAPQKSTRSSMDTSTRSSILPLLADEPNPPIVQHLQSRYHRSKRLRRRRA